MLKKEGETIINLTHIDNLIEEGNKVIKNHYETIDPPGVVVLANHHFVPRNPFIKWKTKTINYLERNLDDNSNYIYEIKNEVKDNSFDEANKLLSILIALKEDFECNSEEFINNLPNDDKVLKILNKFHKISLKFKNRQRKRNPLIINDEYDVQYLLNALLHLEFNEIKPEEWNPSYCGSSTRVDFLIEDISSVIETKMTRDNLKDKEISNELLIDIAHYSQNSKCKKLYCFIYDPKFLINNPDILINDLKKDKNMEVEVIISPKS